MDLNRRKVLTGLIAAPAVLKLGLYMPVRSLLLPEAMHKDFMLTDGTRYADLVTTAAEFCDKIGKTATIHLDIQQSDPLLGFIFKPTHLYYEPALKQAWWGREIR